MELGATSIFLFTLRTLIIVFKPSTLKKLASILLKKPTTKITLNSEILNVFP